MGYSFDDFRSVLRKLGAERVQGVKHEKWIQVTGERVYRVPISRGKRGSDEIPRQLLSAMLREAGLSKEEF